MNSISVKHLVPGKPHLGATVGDGAFAFCVEPDVSTSGKKSVVNRYTLRLTTSTPLLLENMPTVEQALKRATRHMSELTTKHVGKAR